MTRFVSGILCAVATAACLTGTAAAQQRTGALAGRAIDIETGEPISHVQVHLEEAARSITSDADGLFTLLFVPAGRHTLKAYRIGYQTLVRDITITANDTLQVVLRMSVAVVEGGEVIVEGERADGDPLAEAALEMEGARLRQNLGTTIAETVGDQPGISMRSMGPAPARPVLRGLGGERLLVLEDGGRTGDLSGTSSDHAVVVDPMTAERIEVVRGPAALVYGPNTLGGVVNVMREYVPTGLPDQTHLHAGVQAQSVNRGLSGGASITSPLAGVVSLRADGSFRRGSDVVTPEGRLQNTDLLTASGSAGVSVVRPWGYAGVSASLYDTEYGIPGGFVGAHPDGVGIELSRTHLEARGRVASPLPGVSFVEAKGTYSRYFHQEFESNGSLGIEYGLLTYNGSVVARTKEFGAFRKGAVGFWFEYRDYAAGGFSFTPASTDWSVAGFAYQDMHAGPLSVQAGIRYDFRQVSPREERESEVIGMIRQRTSGGVSASAALQWQNESGLTLGLGGMRSLRMPGIEELYSEGPHLAAYSFEVGNPDLSRETGYGVELTANYRRSGASVATAVFYNLISDYIYPRDTGELNYRVYLPIYQFTGAEATMFGGEAEADIPLSRTWMVDASASYVHGTLTDADEPIPWMPPFRSRLGLRRTSGPLTLGVDLRYSAAQERVGAYEEPTGSYAVLDVFGQYHFTSRGILHTIDVGVDNVTNTTYRDHLSRVKSIMPEPGLNVRLLYKLYL